MEKKKLIKLAKKSISGDKEAFEELCRGKQKEIIFNAITILKDYHAAEDVAQEVILAMFLNIRTLKAPEAVGSWINTITQNKCFEFLKKNNAKLKELDIDDAYVSSGIMEDNREFLPEAYAEDESVNDRLYEIVLTLPEKRRETILLYYYEDMNYREIAETMGVSIKTVAANISRARAMIKSELEKDIDRESAAASVPASETVLGRAFKNQASKRISAQSLVAFESKWMASFNAMPFHAAGGANGAALSGKAAAAMKTVFVATSLTAIVAGAVIIPTHIGKQPVDAEPYSDSAGTWTIAESYMLEGRSIAFTDGDCECGHVNPAGADVSGLLPGDSDVKWRIEDANGETVASGSGADADAGVARLESRGTAANYTLHFTLKDSAGNAVRLYRAFEIHPAFKEKYSVA